MTPLSRRSRSICVVAAGLATAVLAMGCLGGVAKRFADREVYPILEQKQTDALGEARAFTIEKTEDPLADYLLQTAGRASDEFSTAGLQLSLLDSLALSVRNNRSYQTQKEALYLSALTLTEDRHDFSPIFSAFVSGNVTRQVQGTGPTAEPVRTGTLDTGLGLSLLLATGARVTFDLASSFVRAFGADPAETASGAFTASIVQPLLRGAGMRVALENLRQAERDVIYAVRDFARFEKDFVVARINEYFRVLQQLDAVKNAEASYNTLRYQRERSDAMAEAGRILVFEADQARQRELDASNRLITAKTRFVQDLDRWRINLGLPTDLNILPDSAELDRLQAEGLQPIDLDAETAVGVALVQRLDYQTVLQEAEDAERRLLVVENSLLPRLDVSASVTVPDEAGQNQPLDLDTGRRRWRIGADLEIPLDRKLERNSYRRALIQLERARRDAQDLHDAVVREVRSSFQDLQTARSTLEVQLASLRLAEQRVDSTIMFFDAGRSAVRDVLEAEDALTNARNAVTRTAIDYAIARLNFLVAIEALTIDDSGMWREVNRQHDVAISSSD